MTKIAWVVPILAAVALLSMAGPVSGHAAAPPLSYMTRLLGDNNDDWFGVQDGHNTIALDAYPAYNVSLGNVLVLRLILSGGYAAAGSSTPELSEHITFSAGGQDHDLVIKTTDNKVFTSTQGFAAVRGPFPQLTADGAPDGDRFYVEGLVALATLGVKSGDALTNWFVTGKAGSNNGDLMPQGAVAGSPDPTNVAFNIGSYALPDVDGYVRATTGTPTQIVVPMQGDVTLNITLANLINDTAQTVQATLAGAGLLVAFGLATPGENASTALDLAGGGTDTLSVRIRRAEHATAMGHTQTASGAHDASVHTSPGNVTLEIVSSLGGHQILVIPLEVTQPAATAAGNDTHDDHDHEPKKDAPGVGLLVPLAVLVASLILRRKR